jgi:hypothetical protein
MKRSFVTVMVLGLHLAAFSYEIRIPVNSDFSLDPIIGITGSESDANSRFIHRMIFSPLVMPMTDPIIDTDFTYDTSLSLVTAVSYKYVDSRGRDHFQKINNLAEPDPYREFSTTYRVQIRNDLYFNNIGTKQTGSEITAEDVIFSYRAAQTTLSIKEKRDNDKEEHDNYTNAILRAQFAELYRVTYIDAQTIEFTFTIEKHAKDFMKFLTFTPILSVEQLRGSKEQEQKVYAFKDGIDTEKYNMRHYTTIRNFELQPASYGQFVVAERITPSNRGDIPLFTSGVKLIKNKNWTPIDITQSNVLDNVGLGKGNHKNYQNGSDKILVMNTGNKNASLKSIENSTDLLINFPLTVFEYSDGKTYIDQHYTKIAVWEMYLSHKLYGMFYSPANKLFDNPKIRLFFKNCLNRAAIIERFKTDPVVLTEQTLGYKALIQNKIEIIPLYYPFYAGNEREKANTIPSRLDDYSKELKNSDISYITYPEFPEGIKDFNRKSSDEQKNIRDYLGGELWEEMRIKLIDEYNAIKSEIPSGRIRIRILYDENDKKALRIADMYLYNLTKLNKFLDGPKFFVELVDLGKLRDAQIKKVTDVPKSRFDVVIYGWDYRFDFLSEFMNAGFFDNYAAAGDLAYEYNQMLSEIGETSVSDKMFDFASRIVDTQIVSTLFGIQNYVIYNKEKIPFKSMEKLGKQIMMYPYYWGPVYDEHS